jgi:hypothetical protein
MPGDYYRGGNSLKPRPREIRIDRATGLVKPTRGVSVYDRPDNLERFGGAHRVTNVPENLRIVQVGPDPTHFEIVPAHPMPLAEYEAVLDKIILVPV